jgi:hypothetical protein
MKALAQNAGAHWHAWIVAVQHQLPELRRHDERGSVTIQEVLWALAAIAFVGIVVGAINIYLQNQVSKIH